MNAEDGSEQTRLTNHASDDVQVDWAPDGTKIAFTSNRDGNQQIFVMNPDGSNPTRLTDGPGSNTVPDWGTVSTSTEPPPTPSEAIEQLISDIENLEGIPQGTKTSLTAPLRQASTILTDDNPNNDESACGKLDAFINQVNAAETRGTLTEHRATDLRTQATDIRTDLGC
jgi:hypothetical protein